MPEAAEVKHVGNLLSTATDRTITKAEVVSGRYIRSPIDMSRTIGAVIERVIVKGKLIVFALRRDGEVFAALSTLGMTGWWYRTDEPQNAKHRRIELTLDDGSTLVFVDQRNFGTFKVTSWAMAKAKQAELGPDIMTPPNLWTIAFPEFVARVQRFGRKATVAEALLDQRIAAGVGNYIRADAMYLASLSPHRSLIGLHETELKALWETLHLIAICAYEDRHPVLPNAGYANLCYGQKRSLRGGTIETYEDKHGRTVWYSPMEQSP